MSRRRAVPALFLLPLLTACAGEDPVDGAVPLLATASHEILTEATVLGPPSSDGPNRLTTGWRPEGESRPGTPPAAFRTAGPEAGVEIAVLTGEARTLALDLAPGRETDEALTAGGHVEVRIDGRPAGVAPLADPLTVAIPAGLAPGRHRVELGLPHGPHGPGGSGGERQRLVVRASRVKPADEGGRADLGDGAIEQRGPSILDLYARPGAGAALTGTLCPGTRFGGAAGLSAVLTGADDTEVAVWRGGGGLDRLRGCRSWRLGPVSGDGPVRVRLAAGPGAGGTWRDLGWSGGGAPPAGVAPPPPDLRVPPPKLLVLYLPDALRADAVGHLGGAEGAGGNPTPVLDRLAAEGHTFREHRTAAPNTLLSMRQLFTGRPVVDGAAWEALGPDVPTLAESLRSAGWRTGLFSANGYLSERFGLARGFDHVSEEALYQGPPPETDEREAIAGGWVNRSAERVHRAVLGWLDSLGPAGFPGDDAPVFLHLQTIHPHGPYAPPPELERRFAPVSSGSATSTAGSRITGANRTLIDLARGRRRASPADRERLRGLYRAGLAYSDHELERFLGDLAERVAPEETVVVVTSDHGEELFDHGGVLHGYTLYEEQLRVPLVVWAPGRVAPGETGRITDTYDLHRTLLDLAGVGPPPGGEASDLHFAAADGPPGGAFAVRWGRFKYIWVRGTPGGWALGQGPARSWRREYLFDLETDPDETRNLSGAPGHEVIEGWLRTTLRAWVEARLSESRTRRRPEGETPAITPEERERLRALGYVD